MTQFEAATAATFVALARRAGRGGGDRGRARRPPRRDQHDPLAGHRADLDRARPHRVAGGDRDRDRRREAGGAARPDDPGPGPGLAPRSRRWPSAPPPSAARAWCGRRRTRARGCGCAPPADFQRRNFALACAAAEAFLGELDPERGRRGGGRRSRSRAGSSGSPSDPPTYLDAAHNPDGAAALAEALPARRRRAAASSPAWRSSPTRTRRRWSRRWPRPWTRAVCTELPADGAWQAHGRPGRPARAPAAELAGALRGRPGWRPRPSPTSRRRCERAPELAAAPPEGALLVAGSHYAIGPAARR